MKHVTFEDIPHEVAQQFDYIKVILFDMAGKGDVWVTLTNKQLAFIWNLLLEEKYLVSTNRRDGDAFTLFSDVKKLVSDMFMVCCRGSYFSDESQCFQLDPAYWRGGS